MQKVMYTKMPVAVRQRFHDCANMIPARMAHVQLYGTLAASSGATQQVEKPSSIESAHTNENGYFQDGDGGPV
jgi:hypothetical protein